MTGQSQYKGFASLDALVSLVPILLILLMLWRVSFSLAESSAAIMDRQRTFNKLASIADYTVKSGAAVHEGDLRYPNWIDKSLLSDSYAESLREEAGLDELHIVLGGPPEEPGLCLYRLVVSGQEKAIERLFVCGG